MLSPLLSIALAFAGTPSSASPRPPSHAPTAGAATSDAPLIVVKGERLTLGDITTTLPRELIGIDLGASPLPGQRFLLYREAFAAAMQRVGVDPSHANGLPAYVQVERPGQIVDTGDLEREIKAQVEQVLPVGVTVREIVGTKPHVVPLGPYTVEVDVGKLRRSTLATVRVQSGGRVWGLLTVQAILDGQAMTPVLRRNLPAKSVVSSQDVEMVATELDQIPEGSAVRANQVTGKQLTNAARAGQVLPNSNLLEPPLVMRGREVNLLALAPGITITQPAIAEEDGKMGQWIRVRPISGTRTLHAKVVSTGEVQLDLATGRGPKPASSVTAEVSP